MKNIIFCFLLVVSAAFVSAADSSYFIKLSTATLYSKPTFDSPPVEKLPFGTPMQIIADANSWYEVSTPNNKKGFVAKAWLANSEAEFKIIADKKRAKHEQKISDLENEVKKVPASEVYKNADIYKQLLELDPLNEKYKKKLAHYNTKISHVFTFRK
ncbi:MAG: SH3 domain-containing protein, partial [Desulfobulbaceae bacterium]|nr:SH3 domain-containing protein [Desulfobulbaceae bacterium]